MNKARKAAAAAEEEGDEQRSSEEEEELALERIELSKVISQLKKPLVSLTSMTNDDHLWPCDHICRCGNAK